MPDSGIIDRLVKSSGSIRYSTKHDAYYDAATGKWLEKPCGDPNCDFCRDRPEEGRDDGIGEGRHAGPGNEAREEMEGGGAQT
jgi:hypothetical protein